MRLTGARCSQVPIDLPGDSWPLRVINYFRRGYRQPSPRRYPSCVEAYALERRYPWHPEASSVSAETRTGKGMGLRMGNRADVPVVILAGGLGTRITEESAHRPKPMIEIGGQPILSHIMRYYASWGFRRFVICAGYKSQAIKEYFVNYAWSAGDVEVVTKTGEVKRIGHHPDDWHVSVIDTGAETMTGGRLRRIRTLLPATSPFCMTYGDGLSDVNLDALMDMHRRGGKLATVTAVTPPGRFGALILGGDGQSVESFEEKPRGDGAFINGGFFILERDALDQIDGDATSWEREPMERLVRMGQLQAYRHEGFWQPMDTLRDKNYLEERWASGRAPWKRW